MEKHIAIFGFLPICGNPCYPVNIRTIKLINISGRKF